MTAGSGTTGTTRWGTCLQLAELRYQHPQIEQMKGHHRAQKEAGYLKSAVKMKVMKKSYQGNYDILYSKQKLEERRIVNTHLFRVPKVFKLVLLCSNVLQYTSNIILQKTNQKTYLFMQGSNLQLENPILFNLMNSSTGRTRCWSTDA